MTRLYVVGKDEMDVDLNKYQSLILRCYSYNMSLSEDLEENETEIKSDSIVECNPDPQLFNLKSYTKELDGKVIFSFCGKKIFLNIFNAKGRNINVLFHVPKKEVKINEDDIVTVEIGLINLRSGEGVKKNYEFYTYKYKATLGKMQETNRFEKYVKNTLPWNQEYGVKGFFELLALLPNTKLNDNFEVADINFTTGVSDVSIIVKAQSPNGLKEFIETVEKLAEITGVIVKPVTSLRIPIK